MAQPSIPDPAAVRRGLAAYQDAIVRISNIVRQGDAAGLAAPVQEICYHAHRQVAQILGVDQPDEPPPRPVDEPGS